MFLFYVYGAGLGHLNRINNFIYTKKIPLEKCVILTNSSFNTHISKPVTVLYKNDDFFKAKIDCYRFIKESIKKYKISTLVVDVFPAGFYGEFEKGFADFKDITTILLARILKDAYFNTYRCPIYNIVYVLEQGIVVEKYQAQKIIPLQLDGKPTLSKKPLKAFEKPFFLVLHSSPKEEVLLLYRQALLYRENEHIYVYTHSDITVLITEKNTTLVLEERIDEKILNNASRIFTGCGFNSILETVHYRNKQHIIPFKRRYDDQFKRKRILDITTIK